MNNRHLKSICSGGVAAAAVVSFAALAAPMTQQSSGGKVSDDARRGHIAAPPGSQTLNAAMDPTSLQLFANANFGGTEELVLGKGKAIPAGAAQDLATGLHDSISSLRWQLPPGIVVILYEDATLKGEQLVLWGSGQQSDLHTWDFNDKASRWAWYNVGGGSESAEAEAGRMPPHGAEVLATAVPENSIQLFKDKAFANDMQQFNPVTATKGGELQKMEGALDDSLTSVRWNLPEGVIVLFYEDADGKRDRVAIWGKGQMSDLDLWDFNDKVSRWSWAYIGAPAKD